MVVEYPMLLEEVGTVVVGVVVESLLPLTEGMAEVVVEYPDLLREAAAAVVVVVVGLGAVVVGHSLGEEEEEEGVPMTIEVWDDPEEDLWVA